ncbi:MAG: TRAP transporter substrate-binding protein DctP [Proteobacteria bacterium]|nr:TRAP transporter substrate-binding protein DctP [Pseudomonadota bacterium]
MELRRVASRLGALALGAWALATAGTGAAQTLPQLRISLDSAATHERTIVVADYLAKLERASGGRLRTRLYHSAQLHKDVAVPRALREGSVEMAMPVGAVLSSFVPDIDIIQLPMFYGQPLDRQHRVVDGPVGDRINGQLEHRLGVKVIGPWLDLGFANYYSTNKPLADFKDLAGLKIRTAADAGQFARARFFGAIPNMTPWPDVPASLARGLCDGLATTHETAVNAKLWNSGVKHAFEDHQFIGYYIPMVSGRFWSRLSAELQRLMVDVWAQNLPQYRQRMASAQDEAHIILAEHGVTFVTPTPQQLASMRAHMMAQQDQIARELKLTPDLVKLATETIEPGG